jgi:hypothetical protein
LSASSFGAMPQPAASGIASALLDRVMTFGHDIRNLLILACTEVEAHWRGILKANGVQRDNLNRQDYVKLAPVLRLPEYSISCPNFPWLTPITPFENWGEANTPQKPLAWYDAYNSVKHDRESSFTMATLKNAFQAVSACAIMICAQFGAPKYVGPELRFFEWTNVPNWHPTETYIFPFGTVGWTPIPYSF